ncbi:MAG: PDZ domain-containing protein [Fimbriimonadaceae bacterium]
MSVVSTLALLALTTAAAPELTRPVEVPFTVTESAMVVDATINGRKLSFMFDTGFSGTATVGQSVNLGKPTGYINLRDFVGQFQAPTYDVTSFKMGDLNLDPTDLRIVQDRGDGYTDSYGVHVDGIMGMQPFSKYVMEINFERNVLIFHPRSVDITQRKPDNKRTFLSRLLPTGKDSLEMTVTAENGKRMVLALDTGNGFYATTHRNVLERLGLWPKDQKPNYMRAAGVASGTVESWYAQLRNVNIYGVPVANSYWSIIDLPSSSAEHDGTIGFQFLKHFNTIIDLERRRVWMENFSGEVENEEVAEIGCQAYFFPNEGRALIVRVMPGSPADKAGVRRGDVLLSIDGREPLERSFRKLNERFEGEDGSTVNLALSRDGALIRLDIVRKPLINRAYLDADGNPVAASGS